MKPTQQNRSLATQNRILDALDQAVKEGRLEALTVNDLVREANCSVGAFYGRFSDKDAALTALYTSHREVFAGKLLNLSTRDLNLENWARKCVTLCLEHALENRALLIHAPLQDQAPAKGRGQAAAAMDTNLNLTHVIGKMMVRNWLVASKKDQANAIAAFVLLMMGATTRDTTINFPHLVAPGKTRRWFVDQLAASVCAYVGEHMS